jgi:hypothetical protein
MKNRKSIQLVLNLYKRDNVSLEEAMQLIDDLLGNNITSITYPTDTTCKKVYCTTTGDVTHGTVSLS